MVAFFHSFCIKFIPFLGNVDIVLNGLNLCTRKLLVLALYFIPRKSAIVFKILIMYIVSIHVSDYTTRSDSRKRTEQAEYSKVKEER